MTYIAPTTEAEIEEAMGVNVREAFNVDKYKKTNFTSNWKKVWGWKGPYIAGEEDYSPYQYYGDTICDGRYLLIDTMSNKSATYIARRTVGMVFSLPWLIVIIFSGIVHGDWNPFGTQEKVEVLQLLYSIFMLMISFALYNHYKAKQYKRSQRYLLFDRKTQLVYFPALDGRLFFKKINYPPTAIPFSEVECYSVMQTFGHGGCAFLVYIGSRKVYKDDPNKINKAEKKFNVRYEAVVSNYTNNIAQTQRLWTTIRHFMDTSKPYPDSLSSSIQFHQENHQYVFRESMKEEDRIDEKLHDLDDTEYPVNPKSEIWKLIVKQATENLSAEVRQLVYEKEIQHIAEHNIDWLEVAQV